MTRRDMPIRRESQIGKDIQTFAIHADGLRPGLKGRRKGSEPGWHNPASGDVALAAALQALTQ